MKQQEKTPWAILAAGAAIQVLTGLPAAWGVFQQPVMEEYGLSERGRLCLRVLIAFFGVGCVIGGFLQDKHGPRFAALWGTGLLCGGFFAAAMLPGREGGMVFSGCSASRQGSAQPFSIRPSSPAPRSGTSAGRASPPALSGAQWG